MDYLLYILLHNSLKQTLVNTVSYVLGDYLLYLVWHYCVYTCSFMLFCVLCVSYDVLEHSLFPV